MDGGESARDNNNYTARRDCLIPVPEINTSQFSVGSGGMSEKLFILSRWCRDGDVGAVGPVSRLCHHGGVTHKQI